MEDRIGGDLSFKEKIMRFFGENKAFLKKSRFRTMIIVILVLALINIPSTIDAIVNAMESIFNMGYRLGTSLGDLYNSIRS